MVADQTVIHPVEAGGTRRSRSGRSNRLWIMVGGNRFGVLQAQNVPALK
jgi:hypothetical protein